MQTSSYGAREWHGLNTVLRRVRSFIVCLSLSFAQNTFHAFLARSKRSMISRWRYLLESSLVFWDQMVLAKPLLSIFCLACWNQRRVRPVYSASIPAHRLMKFAPAVGRYSNLRDSTSA